MASSSDPPVDPDAEVRAFVARPVPPTGTDEWTAWQNACRALGPACAAPFLDVLATGDEREQYAALLGLRVLGYEAYGEGHGDDGEVLRYRVRAPVTLLEHTIVPEPRTSAARGRSSGGASPTEVLVTLLFGLAGAGALIGGIVELKKPEPEHHSEDYSAAWEGIGQWITGWGLIAIGVTVLSFVLAYAVAGRAHARSTAHHANQAPAPPGPAGKLPRASARVRRDRKVRRR